MRNAYVFVAILLIAGFSGDAKAQVPNSAITKFTMGIYGMYTSADPTCQTGLVATIPITATPQTIDFASGDPIGSGEIAATINCIVFVLQNTFTVTWAAGSYSGQTSLSGNANNDSNCNAGTSGSFLSPLPILAGGTWVPAWPSQIESDLAAKGLTPTRSAVPSSATQSEIIPLYLSTYSACSLNPSSTGDGATCYNMATGAGTAIPNLLAPPTQVSDTAHGLKMTAPAQTSRYKFVTNLSLFIGGNGASSCGTASVPAWSFGVAD